MQGFKSFPRKTELPFTEGINVILGPNGSGKSNISDALCFVLGRLSIKSLRAAKAQNLIFLGSKVASPSKEAIVEIVFDNKERIFTLGSDEVSIKRIVRRNGQSIYKINNETKTRQEILTLLALAGVDPNGFNIILQGEIQNFVSMHTEDRRKIIEEVSGIGVYESRKEKSLHELERTDERLREVTAILKERTAYLNNLEKERQQALRYKKIEEDIKKFKASVIFQDLSKAKKETERINSEISEKNSSIEKIKKLVITLRANIENCESKISSINSTIEKSTGLEQEKLNIEIANIRAEMAGLNVKIENYESKLSEIEKQKLELQELVRNNELSIKELKVSEGHGSAKGSKQKELDLKNQELEKLEEERKKFYTVKSELKSIRERIEDKKTLLSNYSSESEFLVKQIKSLSDELFDKNTNESKLESLKILIKEKQAMLSELMIKEKDLEKVSSNREYEIDNQSKLVERISKIDICPICKSKMTESHVHEINKETSEKIQQLRKEIAEADKELSEVYKKKDFIAKDVEQIRQEISKRQLDLVKISSANEKKNQIRNLQEKLEILKREIQELEKIRDKLEESYDKNSNVEHRYETAKVEIQEISLRTDENVSSEISFKQRELERARISLKQLVRDHEDISQDLRAVKEDLNKNEFLLVKKRKLEEELTKKFQELLEQRDSLQGKAKESEIQISKEQVNVHHFEEDNNELKIEKARHDAIVENLETEMLGYPNIEVIKTNKESLLERLTKAQEILSSLGTVNLRSLEVYDSIKKEYDSIQERVTTITHEKDSIMKIIHEIDIKKKKTFIKTLEFLNEIFSRNFSELSTKGQVFLELENRKDPFEGGINIVVKTGHGKYFDVKSLSGGEQTLVALSLIFAIQEYKPYFFYILDEIDAALDKRNSERLANLLKKYMQKGQYIIITHNDEVITNATNLFGVSMHDGVSKIVSLRV
ncbi:chromosome segregation protein SMC [Candidatus Pacearchaeota archaeon]|nr:chromosome segregation protein SMC [Candidatus Pacearchaeota archaeon]